MDSGRTHKKRGRAETAVDEKTPSPPHKSPPHKRHTRSQSNKRNKVPVPPRRASTNTPVRDLVDEIIRIEEEEERTTREREEVFLTPERDLDQNMTNEDELGAIDSFQDMAKFFQTHIEKLPTKKDFEERVGGLEATVKRNSEKLSELEERLDQQKRTLLERPALDTERNPAPSRQETYQARKEDGRLGKFLLAKRSLRIWPIEGVGQFEIEKNLDDFFKKALKMSDRDLGEIIVESVSRTRTSPRARHYLEVLVVFREEDTRELVLSYSRSLADYKDEQGRPTAGLRMEVPDFLGSTFKLLESVSIYLKQKHGPESRRLIKYDDVDMSLYIAFRPKGSTSWRRISPKMAATYREKEDERTMLDFTWSPPPSRGVGVLSQPNSLPINARPATSSPRQPTTSAWVPPPPRNHQTR